MRIIAISLLLTLFATACANACSYSFPGPLKSLTVVDLLVEGRIRTLYINGQQISTSEMSEKTFRASGDLQILIKVVAEKTHRGPIQKEYVLHSTVYNDSPCTNAFYISADKRYFGARLDKTGKFYTGTWQDHVALTALSFSNEVKAYSRLLGSEIKQSNNVNYREVLLHEKTLVDAWLTNPEETDETTLAIPDKYLALMPETVLEARLELLNDTYRYYHAAKTLDVLSEK